MSQQPLEYEQMTYNAPDGAQAGRTSQDLVAFYGAVPVAQRGNAFQQVITVSQTAGTIAVFQSNSQKEPTLTAQNISAMAITFTGAPMLSTADVVFVNKQVPLAQFGIASVRVSTASPDKNFTVMILGGANLNTSGLSTTTPAGDQFLFTAIRGSIVNSVTLTCSSVAPNSTSEQQFTVTGLAPGMVVPVVKASEQAGLGLGGTRVVSNNVLGVTFINTSNTAVTPNTEAYLYAGLAGAAAISPIMTLGLNMSQAPVQTVSGGSLTPAAVTVTGIGTFDRVMGIGQNVIAMTAANSVALVSARVSSTVVNTLNLTFGNLNTNSANITANSTDTWLIPIIRQNNEAPVTVYPGSFPGATIGPNTCTEVAVTVTGITVSCAVYASKPSFTSGLAVLGYRVSAAATTGSVIGITIGNPTAASIVAPVETYNIAAFKPQFGVGHYSEQMISPLSVQNVLLTNEMRNSLAGMGIIGGA